METRELICINCPLGCGLTVTLEQKKVIKVEGNTCPKGKEYAEKEVTAPVRMLTSSVRVNGGVMPVVSVKTELNIVLSIANSSQNFFIFLSIQSPISIPLRCISMWLLAI